MRGLLLGLLAALLGLAMAGLARNKELPRGMEKISDRIVPRAVPRQATIWDTLSSGAIYSQFRKIIAQDEGLRERLHDPSGRFTLFCPTNTAVTNRGPIADKARLLIIAKYHVVEDVVSIEDVRQNRISELPTLLLNDQSAYTNLPHNHAQVLVIREGGLFSGLLPLAEYTGVRRECSNGVIYMVNVMLIPPEPIPGGLTGTPFAPMLKLLSDLVRSNRGLTMFVPNSRAYTRAVQQATELKIVKRHVVVGTPKYWGDFRKGFKMRAMDGVVLQITMVNGRPTVNGRAIIKGNIPTSFGVVHLIDGGINALRRDELIPDNPPPDEVEVETKYKGKAGHGVGDDAGDGDGDGGADADADADADDDILQAVRFAKNKKAPNREPVKKPTKAATIQDDSEEGDGNSATSVFSRSSLLSLAIGGLILLVL